MPGKVLQSKEMFFVILLSRNKPIFFSKPKLQYLNISVSFLFLVLKDENWFNFFIATFSVKDNCVNVLVILITFC